MKKRLFSMLLALVIVTSVCSVASATSTDSTLLALAEKISVLESENAPLTVAMLSDIQQALSLPTHEIIWYDEAGNQITVPEELQAREMAAVESQIVHEYIWYDENGNRIVDLETIAELWSIMAARGSVRQTCCNRPSFRTAYHEDHTYFPPTPAVCLIRRTEIEMCRNCKALISRTLAAEYTHMHK